LQHPVNSTEQATELTGKVGRLIMAEAWLVLAEQTAQLTDHDAHEAHLVIDVPLRRATYVRRHPFDKRCVRSSSRETAQISVKLIRFYLGHSTTHGAAKSASSTTFLTLADYNSNDGLFAGALA
jgi:hypothetical protein